MERKRSTGHAYGLRLLPERGSLTVRHGHCQYLTHPPCRALRGDESPRAHADVRNPKNRARRRMTRPRGAYRVIAVASSRKRHNAFASFICLGVRHSGSNKRSFATTIAAHRARDVATLRRLLL